jgi:hypothetical protein|tara:strand:- start:4551 stop:4796 length:246 start_codon:yes stop_codon:yes gene_type:complete
MIDEKKSILNTFIESIDWAQSMDDLKKLIIQHIGQYCKDHISKAKMTRVIQDIETLDQLQKYTFNALLKFEGQGVVGFLPR